MNKPETRLLIALAAAGLLLPFFVSLLLYLSPWQIMRFKDNLTHSILMFTVVGFSFYASFYAYRLYSEKRDPRVFFSALSFSVIGFVFLLHGAALFLSRHPASLLHEEFFDITEHYGLFFAALLLIGAVFPWGERGRILLHKWRKEIYLAFWGGLLAAGSATAFWPEVAHALYGAVNLVVGLTAVLFFLLLLFGGREFARTNDTLSLYFIFAFAILINSGIIPLFYEEWNALWWYFHLVSAAGLTVIFIGLIKYRSGELGFGEFFGKTPRHRTVGARMLAVIATVGFLPLVAFGLLSILGAGWDLRQEIHNKLLILAEAREGQILAYFDFLGLRTKDFASDGAIRDGVKNIAAGRKEAVEDLNRHLLRNKKPLDETLAGIFVVDLQGRIIAATDEKELGKDESADEYFIEGQKELFISDFEIHEHFGVKNTFIASGPLTDRQSGKTIGVLINVFYAARLQEIFSGKFQLERGAPSAARGRGETTEIYLVNKSREMFVHPGRSGVVGMSVDIAPVRACLEKGVEIVSEYDNYAGKRVIGASVCFKDRGWTLVAEMDANEALMPVSLLEFRFGLSAIVFIVLAFFAAFVFAGRLTRPLRKLHEATEIISGGNLEYQVDIKTGDEVEQLAEAFNRMAADLKNDMRELREEQERLADSISNLPLGFILLDTRGAIILHNPAALRILGLPDRGSELSYEEVEEKLLASGFDLRTHCEVCRKEKKTIEIRDIGFGEKFLRVILTPIIMPRDHQEWIGTVILLEDTTEAKVLERARDEFFSIASHELRTPLTAIRGNASLLMQFFAGRFAKEKDAREMIEDMHSASVRLIKIVSDFLDVSRLELNKIELHKETFDIREVICEVFHDFEAAASEKGLYLRFERPDASWPKVLADRDRTRQVLSNLIANAVNYTSRGGISVAAEQDGAFLKVRVSDTGAGIPAERHSLLFRKFQQAEERILARDVTQGTGLGLYISKLLVEGMGGRITLEKSAPGEGSIFSFALPMAP